MTTQTLSLGIDLGGTNIQAGVVDTIGNILGRASMRTEPEGGLDGVLHRIVACAHNACTNSQVLLAEMSRVGIGSPGGVDVHCGIVQDAENLGWKDVPLAQLLGDTLNASVSLENDANCAAIAEQRFGAGMDSRAMLAVWIGTGIGGGLVLNGKLYRGAFGSAGEIGQMIVGGGLKNTVQTLESCCARSAIVEQIRIAISNDTSSIVHDLCNKRARKRGLDTSDPEAMRITSPIIARAYRKQDPIVVKTVDSAVETISHAVGSVVSLLSLDCVVFGGGLTEAMGSELVDPIADRVKLLVFPRKARNVRIVPTSLGADAGVIGAALGAAK